MQNRRTVLCALLVSALFYALFTLYTARSELDGILNTEHSLNYQYSQLKAENDALKHSIANAESMETIEQFARERLGLVYPDETVFYFTHR